MVDNAFAIGLVVGGYVVGSIPFGILVSRALGTPDPRTAGSKNIGFTNVLRVGGRRAGLLTLVGDAGKGWLVAVLGRSLLADEAAQLSVALAPILGHMFPVFLGFRGGKGVATALGSITGLAPSIGLSVLGIWLGAVGLWRYSSGGALAAFLAFPVLGAVFGRSAVFLGFAGIVSGLIVFMHRGNMMRLYHGTEPRMGDRRELT